LYEAGVSVLVLSYLTKTQIRGLTVISDDKPYIILTNFNKRYDTLWFTLAHELCHVLEDFDFVKEQGYHLSGGSDLFQDELLEDRANLFAREILISTDEYEYIKRFIEAEGIVLEYAEENCIHPSIIYGAYLYDFPNYIPKFRKFLKNSDLTIKLIEQKPWI